MTIEFIFIGKTKKTYIQEGLDELMKRLQKYASIKLVQLKSTDGAYEKKIIQQKEGKELLSHLAKNDYVILLDERGKEMNSLAFSTFLQNTIETFSAQKLCFVIGGAYGFSEEVYQRAQQKLSLSKMTFSHQLIRLVLLEQLYRAFTILKGEQYHHE